MSDWQPIETAPYGIHVLIWIHLEKNPAASDFAIGIKQFLQKDESEDYGKFRRTRDCWLANSRYYHPGSHAYATHWAPLPEPPA